MAVARLTERLTSSNALDWQGSSPKRKLGHNTYTFPTAHSKGSMLITDGVLVEYHNNVIAHILNRSRFQDVLGFGLVPVHTTLSTAGWNSVTTAGRLDQLLSASGAPGRIGITKGQTVYRTHGRELPFDQLYIGPDEIYARNGNATTRVDY